MSQDAETVVEVEAGERPKVVIAGGGLAGLACAKRLVDGGYRVELVEAEPQLGGRTASWKDQSGKHGVESGVHTFFGVYSHLIRLLNEVGVDDNRIVAWDDKVGFLQPGARLNLFTLDPVRDLPNVLFGLLGNNRFLGPLAKLSIGFTFTNGLLRLADYEFKTVAQLARDGGLNRQTYERVIRPLTRGLTFAEPEELSGYVLLTLLSHALLNPWNLRTGTFKGGMTAVMINPIANWLREKGAVLRTGATLSNIRMDKQSGQVSGFELDNGEVLTGDVYVSALPLEVFKQQVPEAVRNEPFFTDILKLDTVPANSVQLWFDQNFCSRSEFIFMSGSPLVVFQDESHLTFPYNGSRISAQITDRDTDGYTAQQLIDLALQELHKYIPASAEATLQHSEVVRHQAVLLRPYTQALRPTQATPVPNFFLAGDYTRQNWFTTMEGATISGEKAASAILRGSRSQVDDYDDTDRDVAYGTGGSGLRTNLGNAVKSGFERSVWNRTPVPRSQVAEEAARRLNRLAERFTRSPWDQVE
ncbi:MAG TPA: FAD-dependent oxidoreductase [Chloroflexia bacterium]|nr:FAD-dependent oxidoreductase [Chloroflexia bacterium]